MNPFRIRYLFGSVLHNQAIAYQVSGSDIVGTFQTVKEAEAVVIALNRAWDDAIKALREPDKIPIEMPEEPKISEK